MTPTKRILLASIVCFMLVLFVRVAQAVTFVQMADPQFGMGKNGYQADMATFKRAVSQINALKPDFVVICGDLIHNWTPEAANDFAACVKEFTVPWYIAPGNHDDWKSKEYLANFAPDHHIVEQGKTTVLVLNTNLWRDEKSTAGDGQLAWLEKALQQAADKHQTIIVAGHHPLFVNAVDEPDAYNNTPLAKRTKILELFEKYKVAAYLTGHLHYNIVGYYKGTLLVTTATTSVNFTPERLGFRIWNIDPKGYLKQEYLPVAEPKTEGEKTAG